jgi:hypothetical protein
MASYSGKIVTLRDLSEEALRQIVIRLEKGWTAQDVGRYFDVPIPLVYQLHSLFELRCEIRRKAGRRLLS